MIAYRIIKRSTESGRFILEGCYPLRYGVERVSEIEIEKFDPETEFACYFTHSINSLANLLGDGDVLGVFQIGHNWKEADSHPHVTWSDDFELVDVLEFEDLPKEYADIVALCERNVSIKVDDVRTHERFANEVIPFVREATEFFLDGKIIDPLKELAGEERILKKFLRGVKDSEAWKLMRKLSKYVFITSYLSRNYKPANEIVESEMVTNSRAYGISCYAVAKITGKPNPYAELFSRQVTFFGTFGLNYKSLYITNSTSPEYLFGARAAWDELMETHKFSSYVDQIGEVILLNQEVGQLKGVVR